MAQESGSSLEDARTPIRSSGRRLSISSTSTRSLHNDSPISARTVSRRHSIAEIESPTFKTPTRSRRKSSLGRVLRDDGSLSSGRISSLPESSPMGIDWSQSLETPAKKRESQGAAKTPITNVIQRLRGLPTTPKGEEQSLAGEFTDWNPSLETPPRKMSLTEKHDILESRISAKVLDELRGLPSSSRPPPQQPAEKQFIVSSQEEDGSFYSAASSILSDDDDDYQNNGGDRAVIIAESTDQEQVQSGGGGDDAAADDNYPIESEISPTVSSFDRGRPEADIVTITNNGAGILLAPSVQELLEGSPIVDSPMESQEFSESQDMFDGFTSAEINHALMSRSTQGSHHLTQPEETGTLSTTSAGPLALSRRISHPNNATPTSPIGFRSASGRSRFQVSANRLEAARRLFEDDSRVATGGSSQVEDGTSVQALASNMLEFAGTFGMEAVDAEEIPLESGSTERGDHMEIREGQHNGSRQDLPEVESDDDFGNIRFSQLDDGFNVVPEPTQKPKNRPNISSTTKRAPLIGGDLDWMARSSDMLGDLFETDDLVAMNHQDAADHQEVCPQDAPPIMGGGFSSASGGRLEAISSAALIRAARMFADDEEGVSERSLGPEGVVPEHKPAHVRGLGGLDGFSSAGKKPLPLISAASKERAMRMMQDSDMDIDDSGFQESTDSAAIPFSNVPPAAERSVFMPPHVGASGFSFGSGKKLAPVSNAALEKWSKEFTEDNYDSCKQPGPRLQQLGGFSSGSGRKLAPVSHAAVERWSKEFSDHDDGPNGLRETLVPTTMSSGGALGGFSSGGGKKLASVSKAAMDKWFNELANEVEDSESRRASEPGRPQAMAIPVPEVGFASGTGKALAPISKAAQARAYSFLELEQPVAHQETSSFKNSAAHSRLSLPSSASVSGSGYSSASSSSRPPTVPSQPPISTHMQNLKMKTLRGSSKVRVNLRDTLDTPKRLTAQDLVDRGLSEGVMSMTFEKARHYHFDSWGVDDAYQELLLRGAKADLLSRAWLLNHYGQVVWKLACYIRTWPEYFISSAPDHSTWFSPTKVLDQLAYRYEREVNRAERPALRKIVEGDEPAAKHMVLVIASISKVDQISDDGSAAQESPWKILVSDGWYTIPAVLDPCLTRAVERGKLKVGSKVHVCRAKLSGAENGVAILELAGEGSESTTVSIVLQANSTRLSRWDTKLGFQRSSLNWIKRLRSIVPEGGLVPGLDVIVLRKYPVLYFETLEDGVTKIKRTVKEESRAVDAYREKIQQRYQDMVREVEKEFASEMDAEGRPSIRVQEEIMMRAQDMQAESATRNVTPLFSIRVGNYRHGDSCDDDDMDDNGRVQEALITFWHDEHSHYQEGHRVRITALMSKKRSREYGFEDVIQLVGTRMTTVQEMPTEPDTMLLTSFRPRNVTPCAEVGSLYLGAEVDLVLVILAVDESTTHSNKAYFVVTDATRRLLLVEHQLSSSLTEDGNRVLPSFLKALNRILMANARFKMRDHKLDLDIVSSTQSYTQVTTAASLNSGNNSGGAGWPSYAQASLQRLNDIVSETEKDKKEESQGEDTILELMDRAHAILRELHPSI
ncbi:Breast cancer 2, early onset [Linnemannia gamsii]|uniref:Breast cancer 2, early onset n=1 Tax=Linnemannia gamsii TaxID=64522 RepID=A0ABQ7JQ26_9FUNG|nr:Breast cancer 2, early onset [Linnemannia gamsii]